MATALKFNGCLALTTSMHDTDRSALMDRVEQYKGDGVPAENAYTMAARDLLEEILANHTGQPIDRIHADTDRDFVMEADEALAYGIIDTVITSRQAVDRTGPIR